MTAYADRQAVARASNYVNHGTTFFGGMVASCICPRQPCGGVSSAEEDPDCPHHRDTPCQLWHWAAECPGTAEQGMSGDAGDGASDKPVNPA